MAPVLNMYGLPTLVEPREMAGGTVVVIDVLRASTSIVHALAAGAKQIIPCLEVEEARATAAGFPEDERVLAGERGGLPPEGFDLGNSPDEFTPETVRGKTLIFTTTNGTRAMQRCREAEHIYIGAFVNAAAVCEKIAESPEIHLLCAGTEGDFSYDDVYLAGLLIERLLQRGGVTYKMNAQAVTARETWLSAFALPHAVGAETLKPEQLVEPLRKSAGGQNLVRVGLESDILTAAQLDLFSIVPELEPTSFRIYSEEG